MKYSMKDFHDGIETLLRCPDLKTVTVFCPPLKAVTHRVRVTRINERIIRRHDPLHGYLHDGTIVINFGRPNYAEREFLALCKKAKCSPKRMWLKHKPERKKCR
jgi:hypothetical protein